MSNAEVMALQSAPLDRPLTASEIRAHVNLIQEVMQAVMKVNVHYGTIPGTPKPTLYKAGAEKILSTFRIAIEQIVDDLSTPDEARYRVIAKATSQAYGMFLGSAVGECSSNEEKYRWRGIVHQKEWDATPDDRKRIKYIRSGAEIPQVRTNPADIANTVLKMAAKRAMIAVTLVVTAASDIFNQDIEDLPEELRGAATEDGGATEQPHIAEPQRKSAAQKPAAGEPLYITEAKWVKSGTNANGEWNLYVITDSKGVEYTTFSESDYAEALKAKQEKTPVVVAWAADQKKPERKNLQSITAVQA